MGTDCEKTEEKKLKEKNLANSTSDFNTPSSIIPNASINNSNENQNIQNLKIEISNLKNDIQKYLKEIEQKNKEIKDNKVIIENNENKIKEKVKEKEKEIKLREENYNKKIKEYETEKQNLIKKNNDIVNKDKNLEKEIKLKEENYNNKIKEYETEKQNHIKNYNDIVNKDKNLEEKIKIKDEELRKNTEELKKNSKEIGELKNDLKILDKKYKDLTEPILVGLDNIGATCYMNATLQSLSNTIPLTDYFLKKYKEETNRNMSNEYYKVIKNLWNRENKSYSPDSFKNVLSQLNPLFQGIAANDSKDLINFLLERFHQELNNIHESSNLKDSTLINQEDQLDEKKMLNIFFEDFKIKFRSIISDLFYGILETKSQCQGCNKTKYNFQVYSFLEFPLEQVNKFCFNKGLRSSNLSNNNNPDVSIYECFNYYGNLEMMTGENQMYCNICKRSCDALYQTNLYSAPNYLIINLNRGKGAVYQCKVIFPEKLNILNFVSRQEGNSYFELYAVICHIGPSSMSGHFVAYCKNKIDKKWYLYNDSFVTPCKRNDEYKNGMAFILFYQAL